MTILVILLYVGLGITTMLILRKMSKRFRDRDVSEDEVPYGPSEPVPEPREREPVAP